MVGQKIELGPTGRAVAHNVKRVRESRSLNYADLSRKLAERGRSISPLAVRRIEEGGRRVDVDDLMALAVALGVNPNSLLLPHEDKSPEPLATAVGDTKFLDLWAWADGNTGPIGYEDDFHGRVISRPVRPRDAEVTSPAELLKHIQELAAQMVEAEKARDGND